MSLISIKQAILELEKVKEPSGDSSQPLRNVQSILRRTKISNKQTVTVLALARSEATPNGGYFYSSSGKTAAIEYLKHLE